MNETQTPAVQDQPTAFAASTPSIRKHHFTLDDETRQLIHSFLTGSARALSSALNAFPLVNSSPFRSPVSIVRIDGARAVVGERWILAIELVHLLAQDIRSQVEHASQAEYRQSLESWEEAIRLSFLSEMIARSTGCARSTDAWICGLLAGAMTTSYAIQQLRQPLDGHSGTVPTKSELVQFLSMCGINEHHPLPTANCVTGPWAAVRMASDLQCPPDQQSLAANLLGFVKSCNCQPELLQSLANGAVELQADCQLLAHKSWELIRET
ncbi:MAG: HDOD domain-containing protein [Planctomycetales bacterium]|nr:HDOD domain-containing protein [Planctomycetales bacterium]